MLPQEIISTTYNISTMEIVINDSKTVSELQKQFNKEFPYLKIEFFDTPYNSEQSAPKSKMYPHDRKLSLCRKKHNDGKVEVHKNVTVAHFERELWDSYGLSVQVFRKSGNLWIETSLTDSWTLDRQNKEGFEMSGAHKNPYKEAEETDITDRDKWE